MGVKLLWISKYTQRGEMEKQIKINIYLETGILGGDRRTCESGSNKKSREW